MFNSDLPTAIYASVFVAAFCFSMPLKAAQESAPDSEEASTQQNISQARSWLPESQNDQYRASLMIAGEHAQQREQCSRVLEAKMADNFLVENPKFIITCQHDSRSTINLVYYQSDIDSNFAEIQEQETQLIDPRLLARLDQECTTALSLKFNATAPDISSITPTVKERSSGNFAVFYDYSEGSGDFQLDFTITCLVNESQRTRIDIFPR